MNKFVKTSLKVGVFGAAMGAIFGGYSLICDGAKWAYKKIDNIGVQTEEPEENEELETTAEDEEAE